jgi:hypothetical protein
MGLLPEIVDDEVSTPRTIEGFPERETDMPIGIATIDAISPEQASARQFYSGF